MSTDAPELPGFYFDRLKNRYFRLLPGHNNHNPLTNATIIAETSKSPQKNIQQINISKLIGQREIQTLWGNTFLCKTRENRLGRSQKDASCVVFKNPGLQRNENQLSLACILPSSGVSLHGMGKYQGFENLCIMTDFSKKNKALSMVKSAPFQKMFDMSQFTQTDDINYTIFTALEGYNKSSVGICTYDGTRIHCKMYFVRNTPWSCAWCHYPTAQNRVSYSFDKKVVMVTDIQRGLSCKDHSVLHLNNKITAQHFSSTNKLHLNGLINGHIVGYDWGCSNKKPAVCLNCTKSSNSRIMHMQLLDDSRTFITRMCSETDRTQLWDLRNPTRYVLQYCCRENVSVSAWKKFHISRDHILSLDDSSDSYVYNILNGKLIATFQEFTSPVFQDNWTLLKNFPGFVGIHKGQIAWRKI